jgi:translation elongation factor EF-Tu-like GTPase
MLGSKNQLEMLPKPFLMPVEDVFSITGRGTVTESYQAGVANTELKS